MKSCWSGWTLKSSKIGVLIRGEDTETSTQGRRPCNNRSRAWRDEAASQEMIRTEGHHKLGRSKERFYPVLELVFADTLISHS